MLVNADFSQRVVIHPEQREWITSPQRGVKRVMLDRIGGEVARATSLVQYDANSRFPRHTHALGEEILVLDGVFNEESDDYPQGWYLRNPPGSSHIPASAEGALIFVKLMQMNLQEQKPVRINTQDLTTWKARQNQMVCPLFANADEQVELLRIVANDSDEETYERGAEILILGGQLKDQQGTYFAGTWMRLPPGFMQIWNTGPEGALIYRKTGHLRTAPTEEVES